MTSEALQFINSYPGPGTPLERLRTLAEAVDQATIEEVKRARAIGAPWTAVAQQLGIARQTAAQRYGRIAP